MQEKYFQWYDDKIRSRFVDSIRCNMYGLPKDADSIPRRLQSSLTTDGGISQLNAKLPRADDMLGKVQVEENAPDNIDLWIKTMGECFVGVEYQYDEVSETCTTM
jgi:hypothetical protein